MSFAALPAPGGGSRPAAHPSARAQAQLTYAELVHRPGEIERWIRFGTPSAEQIVSRRARFVGFPAGAVFAFVRWASNDYGTEISRIDILRAAARGTATSTVPGVA
ncbi:MAG: DUF2840 domain-containing protein, partial [Caulobacteraceae bacterium]